MNASGSEPTGQKTSRWTFWPGALPPRVDAGSNVTRLLCAGAHLDPRFADRVIDELVKNRHRFVAPSFGYDAVAVLGHALTAKRRRRWRDLALLAVPLSLLVFTAQSESSIQMVGVLFTIWYAWLVIFLESLFRVRTLLTLKRWGTDRHGRALYYWPVPYSQTLLEEANRVAQQQRASGVYYSGFVPFVGAGALTRSWSFSVLLDGKPSVLPAGVLGAEARETPRGFTSEQLTRFVERELARVLQEETPPEQRIGGLRVERRWFSTALSENPPPLLEDLPEGVDPRLPNDDYNSARQYLCVTIASWGNELVTSIFVGFDLRGRTLHTELHSYVLPPIKASFHTVDRMSSTLGLADLAEIAARAPFQFIRDSVWSRLTARRRKTPAAPAAAASSTSGFLYRALVGLTAFMVLMTLLSCWLWPMTVSSDDQSGLPLVLILGVLAALGLSRWTARRVRRRQVERASAPQGSEFSRESHGIVDYGARTSVRDLASAAEAHHFFQTTDQDKYTKIIERRLMEAIVDFLDKHYIDTSEYRSRQATVLNFGIMQTGSAKIINTGAVAMGASTSAESG